MRGEQEGRRIGEGVKGQQRLSGQQFCEFGAAGVGQAAFKVGLLQLDQARLRGKAFAHGHGNRKAPAQGVQGRGLQRRGQAVAQPLHPIQQTHATGPRRGAGRHARHGGPKSWPRADAWAAFRTCCLHGFAQPWRVVKACQQPERRVILRTDHLFPQFHRVTRRHANLLHRRNNASARPHHKFAQTAQAGRVLFDQHLIGTFWQDHHAVHPGDT